MRASIFPYIMRATLLVYVRCICPIRAHNWVNLWAAINTRSYCFLISSNFNGRHTGQH